MREETGCEVRPVRILGSRVHPATGAHITYVAAVPAGAAGVTAAAPGEVTGARWLTLAEALELMPDMHRPVRAYLADGPLQQ